MESGNLRAQQAAEISLRRAQEECFAAKINPAPYIDTLTDFVSREVREAIKEMGRDQKTAAPHRRLHAHPTFLPENLLCGRRSTGSSHPHKRDAAAATNNSVRPRTKRGPVCVSNSHTDRPSVCSILYRRLVTAPGH
jgi:hypothetical protein